MVVVVVVMGIYGIISVWSRGHHGRAKSRYSLEALGISRYLLVVLVLVLVVVAVVVANSCMPLWEE